MPRTDATGLREAVAGRLPVMLDDLERLVSCESPSADVAATGRCADVLAHVLTERLGSAPERIDMDGRTHLRWSAGHPARVLLLGHLDTVWPLGTISRWPFSVRDGRATGPGVFDMKAGIVQLLHALAVLGSPAGVTVLVTSDEEIGSPSSRGLIERSCAGVRAALVLEPSAGGAVKTARKGVSWYTLEATGRAAHAGLEPERGANATVALAHAVVAAAALGDAALGTTVTPTVMGGGTTANTVPAAARVHLDVRVERREEQERVDAALHALQARVPGTRLELSGGPNRPPLPRSAASALFARAARLAADLGMPPLREVAVGGGSDGNFTAAAGVPTLDGLGAVGDGAHAEGEHVEVAALAERAALLAALVRDLLR